MPTFSFDFTLATMITTAVKVAIIVVIALVSVVLVNRIVPRLVRARIPRLHRETTQTLARRSDTMSGVITQAISFLVWIIALIMILGTVGVNVTPLLATIGVAGLALGLAAQNIIRDYLHGFFIIMEDWYRVGEVASVAGLTGLVVELNMRRTVLRDLNGTMHVVPNSRVELASNLTRDWARINLNVWVAYGTDLDHAFRVITGVCQEFKEDEVWGPDLLTTPRVERVDELGDSGIAIKILGDTKPIRQWALMGELRKRLKKAFDQEGIEIPWPHTKVYFGNAPDGVPPTAQDSREQDPAQAA